MKKYDGYLSTMKWFFGLAVFSLATGVTIFFPLAWIYGIVLVIVGVFQLVEGIVFVFNSASKPLWFINALNWYWLATAFYFLVLVLIVQVVGTNSWQLGTWLFVMPWFIAVYQYLMVAKLKRHEIAEMEESLWEAEQGEKNLSNSFSDY